MNCTPAVAALDLVRTAGDTLWPQEGQRCPAYSGAQGLE